MDVRAGTLEARKATPNKIAGRPDVAARVSPLPPPEEVFIDWLVSVSHGADLETEARKQIALIDRHGLRHPDLSRLRLLLLAVAGNCDRQPPLKTL